MLTIESLIAVIGLCGTFWCIGYAMGKDSKKQTSKKTAQRQVTVLFDT